MTSCRPGYGPVLFAIAALLGAPHAARAQSGAADVERRGMIHGGARPPAGFYEMLARHPHAFEFKHGWLDRARAVRRNREALRAQGAWSLLNAPTALAAPPAAATAVSGTLRYPTFMVFFANTGPADSALFDSTQVTSRFWGTAPAPPYSVTTYYQEISGGRLTVTGSVLGRGFRVSQDDTVYAGPGTCRGLCPSSRVANLIAELVADADPTVDFAQFADPATGYVPAIVILDPQIGGECFQVNAAANRSIWAHRYSYSGWTGQALTTDDSINGKPVLIDDYIIQGGQGGNNGCTQGVLAPIGTVTHETGHLFGLPDLYDTGLSTEGIGYWDLMSEGNELQPYRPAHMSAWSLATLGWITEVPVTTSQTVTGGPIETGDTAFIIPTAGTPDHEYFLLENRQPIGSDSMMKGPGLLIYHVDTVLIRQRLFANNVNALLPHGIALEQADGLNNLNCSLGQACDNRGDAGDPFPGSSDNTVFGAGTNPAATTNGGAFAGVVIDSIQQLAPFGAMRFRVRFGGLTVVAASDTMAKVSVDGTPVSVYRDLLADGSTHTIAMDSSQFSSDGRAQFVFVAWSDGGARTHTITGSSAGATYTAQVSAAYQVKYAIAGTGTVTATRAIDPASGGFLSSGDSVTLSAVAGAGQSFGGWTGDTTASAPALLLHATRPFTVTATFVANNDVVSQLLTGHSGLTTAQLQTLDLLGNNNGRFDLGDFVAWLDRNPGALSAEAAARLIRRAPR